MYIFIQYPYQLLFNHYFIVKVIMFESQQNLTLMIVEIILNENYCVMITKIIHA